MREVIMKGDNRMKKGIISILSMLSGAAAGAGIVKRREKVKLDKIQKMSDKHLALFLMMNQWVKVKQEGRNLASYFDKYNFRKIAVYGMSYAGETLIEELKTTGIEVTYGIDQYADSMYSVVDIVSVDDELEPVDAVVVTAITFFDEIEEKLSAKVDCPIISLEDILYEV